MSPRRTILFLLVALLVRVTPLLAQDASDIIRGLVVGPDRKPVENVTVTATSLVNNTTRSTRTNKDGRFTIIFNGGGGDYMMAFTTIGYQPMRFEVKREVDEDVLIANATLQKTAVALEAVRITAGRERPGRNDNAQDVGAREQTLNNNNVPIDRLGDLAAMAATMPGVTMIPSADGGASGFSVLGLGADQNNITLNGMNFGGSDLPRDATTQTRVSTSSFDPSRGGFSGGQISLRTQSGTNYLQRSLRMTVDAPTLQYTDAIGRSLGQQFTNLQLSGLMSGPISMDKAFYAFSYQLGQRSSDLQTLLNTDALALERVGVSEDSVFRLLSILNQAGIPLSTTGIPNSRLTQNGSFLTSFDFAPSGTHNFNVTLNGRWSGAGGSNLSTTNTPAYGGETKNYGGTLQLRHSSYFKEMFLDETSVAFQTSFRRGNPYLTLPAARVRVSSDFQDGSAGVSTLSFGGNPQLPNDNDSQSAQIANTISWISLDNKHRFKLAMDARYNRFFQSNTQNSLGTYTYNSLEDFQNNQPAQFTRRLATNQRVGDDIGFSASLGDAYRRTQRLQLTYGLRMDISRFQGNPAYNRVVDSIFGQRNDAVPRGVYFSPRFGFSWTYGTNTQVAGFDGAQRGSRGQLSGGIGQFQNLPSSQLIAGAVDNTGLPTAAQQLICVGGAVPTPNWLEYLENTGMVPTTCVGGQTVYASTVPNVQLFVPDYIPSRSWRANLNWNMPAFNNRFRTSLGGTYSLNLNQQGAVDLNFDRVQRFSLGGEGSRPVFVNPASIVPATGAILSRDARVTQSFAQVTDYRSDLRSRSAQLSAGISPIAFNSRVQWNLTYVWQKVVDMTRGFGDNTSGDPYLTQWSRGARDARHQFTFNVGYTFKQAVSLTAFGRVQSGNPFTPMVQGDVNGDGYNNDRAFIFSPASLTASSDSVLRSGLSSLLNSGPGSVRDCLSKQLGSVAGRNSCEGPWSTSLSLRVSLVSQALKIPDRATVSLGINNPLTGIDALLHGSNNLRGWGAPSFSDPTLLYVRGFDQATQRYVYEVNPRFGASRQGSALNLAPMQITLDVRFDIGPERERQDLTLMLRAGRGGRGQKLGEQALKLRYTRQYQNPFEQMLRQGDSLGLSNEVADSIAILNKAYGKTIDSIWTPVAKYLAALPDKYNVDEAYERVRTAENKAIDQMAIFGPTAKSLLTAEQIRKLPPFIALFLDNQALRQIRPGRAGGGRGGFFGM